MISWLLHVLGIEPRQTSTAYNFWSGFGADLMYLAVIGGLARHFVCQEYRCLRPGTHVTVEDNGHHYRRCTRHHKARHA